MIALMWIFVGIEGAAVISGRAKYVQSVGRATTIGFLLVFVLYLCISLLSLGIMTRAEMVEMETPSLAGPFAPKLLSARVVGTLSFIYTLFLVWSSGLHGVMVMNIVMAPGLIIY